MRHDITADPKRYLAAVNSRERYSRSVRDEQMVER